MLSARSVRGGSLLQLKKASISKTSAAIQAFPRHYMSSSSASTSIALHPIPRNTLLRSLNLSTLPASRRSFCATATAAHGHLEPPKEGEALYVTFIDKDGSEHKIAVSKGDNLLTIAQAHDIDMEGACEGSCACSTCHVIVEDGEIFDKMPEATDDENDMLDLAYGLTETSRLGCQVEMTPELDGLRVKLPNATRNLQASDFNKKASSAA